MVSLARLPMPLVVLAAVATSACMDELRPLWVLGEEPRTIAIRADVVEDGPYATSMGPLPPDRLRGEVLPLDRVRLRALVATVEGPLDLEQTQAEWFLCRFPCTGRFPVDDAAEIPECEAVEVGDASLCRLARGGSPEAPLPDFDHDTDAMYQWLTVVTGSPGGPTTAECVQARVRGSERSARDCSMGVRELPVGPVWALIPVIDFFEAPIPPATILEALPPNSAPEIDHVWIAIDGDDPPESGPWSVHETIPLPTGTQVAIRPELLPQDRQFELGSSGSHGWVAMEESVRYTAAVDHLDAQLLTLGLGSITIRTPAEPGDMRMYVSCRDGRGATSWFILDIELVDP